MDCNEMLEIGNELVDSVRSLFPSYSDISFKIDFERKAYKANIRWLLGNDPKRPNKLSRMILIVISKEALMDCDYYKQKSNVIGRFTKCIELKLKKHNPEHDNSPDMAPPVEEWLISRVDLV